ncbi:hypothetical protein AGDE_14012 [Angomonas deanei]|uniref:Concanavalin A-like lectin/glucanases superfamily n=1 Tax=Angomonas deanei TaxID=59799 RepID=A0A7G2CI73_9TRYP|nr:hypothetical protein AGDE_14012 [Angomonas deanei]CAD2219109.1 hypothetical protein, conserved [Angomonas deanei]|eukprot:EPY21549.1 hypothetical protein AGDE_14012 [Angomonas deanei]
MSFVCGILVNIQKEYDITDFVGFIVDCLLKCSIKDGDSKLVLVDFFVSYVSNNPEVGASVIRRGLLQAVLRNVDKESFQAEPTRRYVERLSVLLKILIREDTDTKPLEEVEFPNALLDLLLFFFEKGEKRTAVVLRDMYSFLLIKTMSFFNNIVIRLSNATETKPWGEDTTVLLATLIGALRKRTHAEKAIASNALELCFTLVRDIENSLYPAVDLELLGCILNFILPSVAHSDVWVLFESSIGTMRRTTESTQFVIDLCCGDFQTLKRMRMAALVFEEQHPEIDRRGPGYHVYGEYFLPKTPFCEFEYLLNVLFNWSSQAFEKSEADSDSLVKVVESLLVLSGTKISNTYAVKHIMTHGRLGLLPCVMNITDPTLRPLFFSDDHSLQSILHKQDAWLAALQHSPVEENEYKYNVRFAGPSGASGLVKCTEMWPSLDGYSVSIWVSWNLLASTEADQRMQLWQMSWVSSGKRFAVSLSVNATKECCYYTISEDQASQTVELPYIPPYSWTHVVTSHRRTKLFSSDISVYFNGCNVLSKEFSYPFGVQTAMNSVAAFPSFFTNLHCTVGSSPDYSGQAAMSLISFSVFNCELSSEDVFSLYSYGPNPKGGAKWDKGGTDTVSIESNYLHDEVLRGLEVCNSTDQLDSVCEQRFLTFSLPF